MTRFDAVVAAVAEAVCAEAARGGPALLAAPYDDAARFAAAQVRRMPVHLRAPVMLLTLSFDLAGVVRTGRSLAALDTESRVRRLAAWRASSFGPCRSLARLYETLCLFRLFARLEARS